MIITNIPNKRLFAIILSLALILRITYFLRPRSPGSFASVDGFAIIQIIIVFLSCIYIVINFNRISRFIHHSNYRIPIAIFGYYVLALTSTLWSPLPMYSFYRSVEVLTQILLVFGILSTFRDIYTAEKTIIAIVIFCMAINLIGTLKLHGYNLSLSSFHTNTYSNSAAMISLYCFSEYLNERHQQRKRLLKYGFILGLFIVILSTSTTAYVAYLVTVFIAAMRKKETFTLIIMLAWIILSTSLFIQSNSVFEELLSNTVFYGKDVEHIESMTGRTAMWNYYYDEALKKPFIGSGFAVATKLNDKYMNTAHNMILAVFLDLGMLGLLYLLYIAKYFIGEMRKKGVFTAGALSVLIYSFIASQSTPYFATEWTAPMLVMICLISLPMLRLQRQRSMNRRNTHNKHKIFTTVH